MRKLSKIYESDEEISSDEQEMADGVDACIMNGGSAVKTTIADIADRYGTNTEVVVAAYRKVYGDEPLEMSGYYEESKMDIKLNETVTLKAKDGTTGQVVIAEHKDGKVTVKYGNNKSHTMSEKVFQESVVAEPSHMPFKSVWKNQFVQVIERGSQKRVDSGLVSEVTADAVFICGEKYEGDKYDFLTIG
jgi:hypothetical protein